MSGNLEFDAKSKDKAKVFQQAANILFSKGFRLIDFDVQKPWGFYLSVDEDQAGEFIKDFYDGVNLEHINTHLPQRPKFLGIASGKRLSWQYHHRRAETWRCLAGQFKLVTSQNDTDENNQIVKTGQVVSLAKGIRHRGVGLDEWALVAEIWQHIEPDNPSNEDDIVRVQDDFGR